MRASISSIALLGALALAGCRQAPPAECTADTDGDGLTDCEEAELGTAPHLADTDGDGFTDREEVVELGFLPQNNNFRFNPRIADTPRLRVVTVTAPDVYVDVQSTTGTVRTVGIERTEATSTAVTTGQSSTNSRAIEQTTTSGGSISVGGTTGLFGGVSASATVSYSQSESTTQETSLTWSSDQRRENSEQLAQVEQVAQEQSETLTGGGIRIALDVFNDGNLAYTLTQLSVSALMTTPGADELLVPVGNLSYDTTQTEFPGDTIAPADRAGPWVFVKDDLDLRTVRSLLAASSQLDLRISGYEVTDREGRSFTHEQTEIQAKTATVIVDYDGELERPTERYQVATNIDPDINRVSVAQVMQDVLRLPYELDDERTLASAREVVGGDARFDWEVALTTSDGVVRTISFPQRDGVGFDELWLQAGDVLHLVYFTDEDGDGLGRRVEASIGSDPRAVDTDGDFVQDGDEVWQGTNPVYDDRPHCPVEEYDVNGDRADGCEYTDPHTGNHTRETARSAGSTTPCDGSSDPDIVGWLPSDLREDDPALPFLADGTGTAPDWWELGTVPFVFCENEIALTLTVEGAADPTCFEMTIYTDLLPDGVSCRTDEAGRCTIERLAGDQFSDDTSLFFEITRVCPPALEVPTYSIDGHL